MVPVVWEEGILFFGTSALSRLQSLKDSFPVFNHATPGRAYINMTGPLPSPQRVSLKFSPSQNKTERLLYSRRVTTSPIHLSVKPSTLHSPPDQMLPCLLCPDNSCTTASQIFPALLYPLQVTPTPYALWGPQRISLGMASLAQAPSSHAGKMLWNLLPKRHLNFHQIYPTS